MNFFSKGQQKNEMFVHKKRNVDIPDNQAFGGRLTRIFFIIKTPNRKHNNNHLFYLFNQVYHLICGLRLLWTASFSDINGVLAGVVKD